MQSAPSSPLVLVFTQRIEALSTVPSEAPTCSAAYKSGTKPASLLQPQSSVTLSDDIDEEFDVSTAPSSPSCRSFAPSSPLKRSCSLPIQTMVSDPFPQSSVCLSLDAIDSSWVTTLKRKPFHKRYFGLSHMLNRS